MEEEKSQNYFEKGTWEPLKEIILQFTDNECKSKGNQRNSTNFSN